MHVMFLISMGFIRQGASGDRRMRSRRIIRRKGSLGIVGMAVFQVPQILQPIEPFSQLGYASGVTILDRHLA